MGWILKKYKCELENRCNKLFIRSPKKIFAEEKTKNEQKKHKDEDKKLNEVKECIEKIKTKIEKAQKWKANI